VRSPMPREWCEVMAKPEIRVFSTPNELFEYAAQTFATQATEAIQARDRFTVALSGGSTPKNLYSLLAQKNAAIPWDKVYFFWGDERHVPPDDLESNYRMVRESLLSRVPIPAANVFRVHGENLDAAAAAAEYEETLRNVFKLKPGELPKFDLILLGLGPDAHTASLFPGTKALNERSRLVVSNRVEKFKTDRITFTVPVLNNARVVTFLASGKDKTPAVASVFDPKTDPEQFPAKLVQPVDGKLVWLLDRDAAGSLDQGGRS
jgi:6-phosphogluconolactonase